MKSIVSTYLKLSATLSVCLVASNVRAQPAKPAHLLPIHLIEIKDEHKYGSSKKDLFNSVQLENKSDTAYVRKRGYGGDMGGPIQQYGYVLKTNLPDGVYKRFINKVIQEEITILNGRKEGMDKTYINGVLRLETPYRLGKRTGYRQEYCERNGGLCSVTYYYEDVPYISSAFDTDGNVILRSYQAWGLEIRAEGLQSQDKPNPGVPVTKDGVEAKGIRNGLYELAGRSVKYQIFFENNIIKWWKCMSEEGKLMVEVHAQPGQRL